jgi:protein SFI1
VLRAQQRHDVQRRPKRALFEAYETVFAENGLDTRQDRACLRIVLQLGEPQVPGVLLYDKFEFVLRQMGVNLAFGDDEPAAHNDQEATERLHSEDETIEKEALLQASPSRPRRRASFSSMHDVTTEQIRQAKPRQLSRASESRLYDERVPLSTLYPRASSPDRLQETNRNRQRRFSHDSPSPSRHGLNHVYGNRIHTHKHQPQKNGTFQSELQGRIYSRYIQDKLSLNGEFEASPQKTYQQELFYRLSTADMDRDALAFEDMRLRNVQRNLLGRWVHRARVNSEHVRALELQAVIKDFLTLKRQALDFWRTAYDQKRQQVREERFFEHLHSRAGRAYDLYLLTKSFTHWIQITAGAVAKTNAARQHFLSTKYFNAWYQLTVTNELKAGRQILKAPFNRLRKRAALYYHDQINALEVYHANLTKYVFWRWFREWCNRAAPRYREQQLQRSTFSNWLRRTRENRSREHEVEVEFVRRSLQKLFRSWATQARVDIAGYHQADAFRRSLLLERPLAQWSAEARLKPMGDKLSRMRDWRIARTDFSVWQLRTRMVFRADAVNTMRTLQNAYTAWNERLRSQALASRIDERVVAEALYKWVIAQRCALMKRISEQYRKRTALQTFLTVVREKRKKLSSKEEQLVCARKYHLLGSTLISLRHQTVALQARWTTALDFYNPKLKQDTMEAVRLKLKATEKLEIRAKDARFYYLMTRSIAIWRSASADRKKVRERAAHARMRRKCKMSLARNMLYAWSLKRRVGLEAYKKGEEVYQQKIKALQQVLFRDWQTTASRRRQEALEMSTRYDDRLLDQSLGLLIDASRHLYSMQSRAEQFYHLKISEICSAQVRRFSMRAFEIRRREQDADAMHDRHWNKHVRNMIRHWASKSQDSIYKGFVSNAPTEKPQESEPTDAGYATASNEDPGQSSNGNDLGTTRRAEEWTAFDKDLLEASEWISPIDDEPVATSTPVPAPGYLNTPSKRAARATALANLSTTPATPLRTPFVARLRAGMGSSPSPIRDTTARRGGLGFRSALGSNVRNTDEDD